MTDNTIIFGLITFSIVMLSTIGVYAYYLSKVDFNPWRRPPPPRKGSTE
jgi:hypothetical protein